MITASQKIQGPSGLYVREPNLSVQPKRRTNIPLTGFRQNVRQRNELETRPVSLQLSVQGKVEEKRSNEKFVRSRIKDTLSMDPRYLEYNAARRSKFVGTLRRSYADKNETPLWALLIWTMSFVAFSPFMAITVATSGAMFVSFAWSMVHCVRRA